MLKKILSAISVLTLVEACANPARTYQAPGAAPARATPAPTIYIESGIGSNPHPQTSPPIQTVLPLPAVPSQVPQNSGLVEFRIPPGTGSGPWNSASAPLIIKIPPTGSVTLRIINDDTTGHTLHTNGFPCPHGNIFTPLKTGAHYDCVIRTDFDSVNDPGAFHDHLYGDGAAFSVRVSR